MIAAEADGSFAQIGTQSALISLGYVDLLKEYEGKLVIDWGGSARMWHQKATTPKPIIAIESRNQKSFVGFEKPIRF